MSNFEHDLFSSTHILNKIHTPPYAQHLYAALCNNELQHDSTSTRTHYTWRGAGGLVADLEARSGPSIDHIFNSDTANHIRWYCSGMFRNDDNHWQTERFCENALSQRQNNLFVCCCWTRSVIRGQ